MSNKPKMRLGCYLPTKSSLIFERRASGFFRACQQFDDVEPTFVRLLSEDQRGLPRGIDGLAGTFEEVCFGVLRSYDMPLVHLENLKAPGIARVMTDMERFGGMVAEFVLSRGGRDIALYVEQDERLIYHQENAEAIRLEAIKRGLKVHDLPLAERSAVIYGWSLERDIDDLQRWMRKLPVHTTIVCSDDDHAYRAVWAAREDGIDIPGRLLVLGIGNNSLICDAIEPSITSIMIDHEAKGAAAAKLLRSMVLGECGVEDVLLPPREIVARQSTGFAHADDPTMKRIFEALSDWTAAKPDLKAIARHAGVSLRTLHRKVKQKTGLSPERILMRIRLERAMKLLRTSDLDLAAIADEVGYALPSQLSREVKRETGLTASEYRTRWE